MISQEDLVLLDNWKRHPTTTLFFESLNRQRTEAIASAVNKRRIDLTSAQLELEKISIIDKIIAEVRSGSFLNTNTNPT